MLLPCCFLCMWITSALLRKTTTLFLFSALSPPCILRATIIIYVFVFHPLFLILYSQVRLPLRCCEKKSQLLRVWKLSMRVHWRGISLWNLHTLISGNGACCARTPTVLMLRQYAANNKLHLQWSPSAERCQPNQSSGVTEPGSWVWMITVWLQKKKCCDEVECLRKMVISCETLELM